MTELNMMSRECKLQTRKKLITLISVINLVKKKSFTQMFLASRSVMIFQFHSNQKVNKHHGVIIIMNISMTAEEF